jgi:hypothetical protein
MNREIAMLNKETSIEIKYLNQRAEFRLASLSETENGKVEGPGRPESLPMQQ